MKKSLVIVESPAKAKTINKYLGNHFIVKSSIGHIRDLPKGKKEKKENSNSIRDSGNKIAKSLSVEQKVIQKKAKVRKQLFEKIGVNPDNNWQAQYEIIPGKEKVVAELQRLAKNVDTIYLATDLDREGEAIAWHIQQILAGDISRYKRVVFNEITKTAVRKAFDQPSILNIDRVNAQQARRFLDRVVGFMLSPLLWLKIARGLSAGRVQSVAVRLIVEKEKEIRKFTPEEYWEIDVDLEKNRNNKIKFHVIADQGKPFKPENEFTCKEVISRLNKGIFYISGKDGKPSQTRPSAPFITSTLQQAASSRLGFSVKKTMMLAQRLYESGYITYMRTDSTNLSREAIESARTYISKKFNSKYLPSKPNIYASNRGAQEAHEAIRPSDIEQNKINGLDKDSCRLYELIWQQFLACQMSNAEYFNTKLFIEINELKLVAKGRILKFDGFTKLLNSYANNKDIILPDLEIGDLLNLIKVNPHQLFTKPPARFKEAALVKELEKRGIGRPSTYASIISTIQERGYVKIENRRFYAQKMGDIVTARLTENFNDLMDYSFTALMEDKLDLIAQGKTDYITVLNEFYRDFSSALSKAEMPDSGMRSNKPTITDIKCSKCHRNMMIRTASTGVFLGCSGYTLSPKERCKNTLNLIPNEEIVHDSDENAELEALKAKKRCFKCHASMESYLVDERRKLHVCGNNPDCDGFLVEEGKYKIKGYEGPVIECDKCSSEMRLKSGRFGKYFDCTNDNCKNTRKLLKSGEPAPPKIDPIPMSNIKCIKVNDFYVLRDGASGLFLAASQFPKHREIRAPKVKELIMYKDKIDPKYHYLLLAPIQDSEKNLAIVRFSRKTKTQYVMTEKNGKATGWSSIYENGKWTTINKKKKK